VAQAHRGRKQFEDGDDFIKTLGMYLVVMMLRFAELKDLEVLARVRTSNGRSRFCLESAATGCGRAFIEVPAKEDFRDVEGEVMYDKYTAWKAARAGMEDHGEETEEDKVMKQLECKNCYTHEKIQDIEAARPNNAMYGCLRLYRMPLTKKQGQ
jgi:hypothetical protein